MDVGRSEKLESAQQLVNLRNKVDSCEALRARVHRRPVIVRHSGYEADHPSPSRVAHPTNTSMYINMKSRIPYQHTRFKTIFSDESTLYLVH